MSPGKACGGRWGSGVGCCCCIFLLFLFARKVTSTGHFEKLVGWFPPQLVHVGGVSGVFVQFWMSCVPAHLTHFAVLLQFTDVCPWA